MLSVVILNYNVCNFLRQCILSVEQAIIGIEAEIIVVDNNSSDSSKLMMQQEFPEILFLQNKENLGFGVANNQAVAHAKGKYVCILNPDTAVAPDVFTKCLSFIEKTPNCGAIGVQLIDGTGNFLPESKRNLPTLKVSLSKLLPLGRKANKYYASHIKEEETGQVAILVGAFMFMKRSLYTQVGGFDKDYFMYGEDIDLSYKIELEGYKNYYLGSAKVLHYKGESTHKDKEYLKRFYTAMYLFYKKHFSKNPFMDALVYSGVEANRGLKALSRYRKEAVPKQEVEVVYLISKSQLLYHKLKAHYSQSIYQLAMEDIPHEKLHNALFVWDAEDYDYGQILDKMQRLTGYKARHRIRPSGTWQLIGSDTSETRGLVIQL